MGDVAVPPLVVAVPNDEPASKGSDSSPTLVTGADKTSTSPLLSSAAGPESQSRTGSAIFSTGLGKRKPRKLQGPPYAPVIVRSNRVQDVLAAAGFWLNKYPQQYLCIFPQAGWQIGDLWDEEDIHIETAPFCEEVLQFIGRDVYVRAKKYAQHWSRMHPERLNVVGGDLTNVYDKTNPLSIVDVIFVNGEQQNWPSIFLWHVAHTMRAAMLEVKGTKLPVMSAPSVSERMNAMAQSYPMLHQSQQHRFCLQFLVQRQIVRA
jgi:hypothetical protein